MNNKVNSIYLNYTNNVFDNIILKKRIEMLNIINSFLEPQDVYNALDVGTTEENSKEYSNYIIYNLKKIKEFKSITNQKIINNFFSIILNKSITSDFFKEEIENLKSDVVISNATIEHVGEYKNQLKMIENMIELSKKYIVISTPLKSYPLEFHTMIPFLHWLPRKIYYTLLNFLGMKSYADINVLNLLNNKNITDIKKHFNEVDFSVFYVKLFGIKSNVILIGKLRKNSESDK